MTLAIYIPSMGRSSVDEIQHGPLMDNIGWNSPYDVHYVVPLTQTGEYVEKLQEAGFEGHCQVLSCPDEVRGIAQTRHWIGKYAEAHGHDKFLMLDDDIRFLVRRSPETWQLRAPEHPEVMQLLDRVDRLLDTYGHVGVSAREGNNRLGEGGPDDVGADNTRTLRALAYQTEPFLRMKHGRVEVMEDFDVNLQLLESGLPNHNIGYWAQGQKMTNAPGGCSTYRSHEVHERSAHELARLHPGLVALRQKTNKTDADGFGTRTEVTIQWKRAYNG